MTGKFLVRVRLLAIIRSIRVMIRPYRPEDRSDVLPIFKQLQDHLGTLDPAAIYRKAEDFDVEHFFDFVIEDNTNREGVVMVAELDGAIVGLATGSVLVQDKEWLLSQYPEKIGILYELCVDETKRSGGIGRQLVDEMERYFASIGCTAMQVECLRQNEHAYRFYLRHGFTERNIQLVKRISLPASEHAAVKSLRN